ncbi:MAG TPA: alpha-glucuronidase family glycosyl hydrolase, partial [Opitutus sp.]|nr:alpha-glucuronidase family glycosyl hydrolase [Opitutus sp.]
MKHPAPPPLPLIRPARIVCGWLLALAAVSSPAFEYDRSIGQIAHLPVTLVEKPFVLRFSPEELLAQPVWSKRIDGIVLSNLADAPTRTGARELQNGLVAAKLGDAPLIEIEPSLTELPRELAGKHVVVLGRPDELALVRTLVDEQKLTVTDERLNGDGFIVKPLKKWDAHLLLVTSCVSRGVMYGAFELEERSTSRGVPRIDESFVPAVRDRAWSFWNFYPEPPGLIGRSRYNHSIHYFGDWPGILAYPAYPELGGEKNVSRRLERQTQIHRMLGDATKYGATPGLIF